MDESNVSASVGRRRTLLQRLMPGRRVRGAMMAAVIVGIVAVAAYYAGRGIRTAQNISPYEYTSLDKFLRIRAVIPEDWDRPTTYSQELIAAVRDVEASCMDGLLENTVKMYRAQSKIRGVTTTPTVSQNRVAVAVGDAWETAKMLRDAYALDRRVDAAYRTRKANDDLTRLDVEFRLAELENRTTESVRRMADERFRDPYSGGPYRWDERSGRFYSVGPDRKDDRAASRSGSLFFSEGDIYLQD